MKSFISIISIFLCLGVSANSAAALKLKEVNKTRICSALSSEHNRVVFLDQTDKGHDLQVIEVTTGKVLSSVTFSGKTFVYLKGHKIIAADTVNDEVDIIKTTSGMVLESMALNHMCEAIATM